MFQGRVSRLDWPQRAAIQAKLDEVLRALDQAREEFVGIEHLTDSQICAIRAALEREVIGESGGPSDAKVLEESVDQLLKRR